MDAVSGTDSAIGWLLILGAAFTCYYGIPLLLGKLVDSIASSAERDRLQRELVQEEWDEALRQELLALVAEEEDRRIVNSRITHDL